MYIKVHKLGERQILAVCDEEVIGKKFEQGQFCLEVSEMFYKGKRIKTKELETILKNYDNINIIGDNSIKVALKAKIIKKVNIIKIQGIPHAQIFSI